MRILFKVLALALLILTPAYSVLTFVQAPGLTRVNAATWQAAFEVSEATDVEVAIVNLRDSSIVRRLAAGMLGPNAPLPLAQNALHQVLTWDGTDDLGRPVTDTASLSVRVRSGMSVTLDRTIGSGNNPYFFSTTLGAALGDDGSVYVYGVYGNYNFSLTVRKYDGQGSYQKTLFPFPAGMDTGSVYGFGINLRTDNTYVPKYNFLPALRMSTSMIADRSQAISNSSFKATKILPFMTDGKPTFYSIVGDNYPQPNKIRMVQLSENSSIARDGGEVPLLTSPALPSPLEGWLGGSMLFTRGPDSRFWYLSSAYMIKDLGSNTYGLVDTGFWQDGRVYRLNAATGAAVLWHTFIPMDSIPDFGLARYSGIGPEYNGHPYAQWDFSSIHGLAFDNAGHVLVCDRLHQEVGVYDTTTWTRVGAIPVLYPHQVEVNRATGEVYVLSRQITGYSAGLVSLRKYAGWQNPAPTASLLNFIPSITHYDSRVRMVVTTAGAKPILWLTEATVWTIQDDGDHFTVIRKFSDLSLDEISGKAPRLFERMALDRKTETLYSTNGVSGFYKITDWGTGTAVVCSTSSRAVLYAGEACVSPDNYLYVREGNNYTGPVTRYTTDYYPAPAPFAGRSNNVVDTNSYGRMGVGWGDKGIAVSRTGRVAIMDMVAWVDYILHVTEPDGSFSDSVLYPLAYSDRYHNPLGLPTNCGGVKFDRDGNIYAGALMRPKSATVPAGFAGDPVYTSGIGAVVKFPLSGGSFDHDTAVGALKVYAQELGGFSGGPDHYCACRTPRFDLDGYGRLFIPNALSSRVTVCDNNGNNILSFGEYGNFDSKGPGSLVPGPVIPLASPLTVAASDNYLYIGDVNNARLVRVKMSYALENIHLSETSSEGKAPAGALALGSSPNPFNPVSRISVSLPAASSINLAVYNINGRLVRTLASGDLKAGTHHFTWDARDAAGRSVSAGVYLYKLTAGKKVMMEKAVLAK